MKNVSGYYLLLLAFFLTVVGLGGGLCYLHMKSAIKDGARSRLTQTVTVLDTMLEQARQAAAKAENFTGRECSDSVLTAIRTLVVTHTYIRTVGLVKDHAFYCSSLLGKRIFPLKLANYTDDTLILLGGNQVSPTGPLIIYNLQDSRGNAVRVGIDGFYVYNALRVLGSDTPLHLQIGPRFLDGSGKVTAITKSGIYHLNSSQFQYVVIAEYPSTHWYRLFIRYESRIFAVTLMVSLLLTFFFSSYLRYRSTAEYMLREGIRKKELKAYIQPIVKGDSGDIIGGEVLVRWKHPTLGFIPPDKFIPVAEQYGLIKNVTALCFDDVIQELSKSARYLPKGMFICFNVSASNFEDDEVVMLCSRFLKQQQRSDTRIVLEITERDYIKNSLQTTEIIRQLRNIGVQFSLDDFGTGHANYSYLSQFRPEFIKIDKMFTSCDLTSRLVVRNMVDLAHKFHCYIIAEGVEDSEQFKILQGLGISFFQGYYLGYPQSVKDFTHLVVKNDTSELIGS